MLGELGHVADAKARSLAREAKTQSRAYSSHKNIQFPRAGWEN